MLELKQLLYWYWISLSTEKSTESTEKMPNILRLWLLKYEDLLILLAINTGFVIFVIS